MDKKMIGDKEDNTNQILKQISNHLVMKAANSPATQQAINNTGESTVTMIERLRKNLLKLLKVSENVTPRKDELPF